jgi:tetratricopeptide (TPR) repeat protein
VRLARGDADEARLEFRREVESGASQLYAAEFAMNAYDGDGFASLRSGDAPGAAHSFERALDLFPAHARSLVGYGAALAAQGQPGEAAAAFDRAAVAIDALRRGARGAEGTLAEAFLHSVQGRPETAIECLAGLLDRSELPFAGWTIPVEPLFEPLRANDSFNKVLSRLADRAR